MILLLILHAVAAAADPKPVRSLAEITCTWNGPANGLWSVAGNWNPNNVPNNGGGNTYNVVAGAGSIRLDLNPTIEKMELSGATIDDPASTRSILTNQLFTWTSGTVSRIRLSLSGGMALGPTPGGASKPRLEGARNHILDINKTITMSGTELTGAALAGDATNISLLNLGTLDITDDSSWRVAGPRVAQYQNSGQITKSGGAGTSTIEWKTSNTGTVRVKSGELKFTNGFSQGGNSSLTQPDDGATLTSTSDITIDAGTIGGAGTVKAPKIINNGKVQPELAPGKTLTFESNYECQSGGASRGPTVSSSSVGGPPFWGFFSDYSTHLLVTGTAELAGLLEVAVWPGYVPSPGVQFEIMTVDSTMGGGFDNVANGGRIATSGGEGTFLVRYGSPGYEHRVVLTDFAPTPPAPSTSLPGRIALSLGLACLGGLALRRSLRARSE